MEKNFVCPVCGAVCKNLMELKNCIIEHEKVEKDMEKKKTEQEIKRLDDENKKLISKIKKNCEILKKFGVIANCSYSLIQNYSKTKKNNNLEVNDIDQMGKEFLKTLLDI